MTEVEKIEATIQSVCEHDGTHDEWITALLSSIAHSLAVIADKIGEDNERE